MRLELHRVKVRDIQWGEATEVRQGTLYVNREEALKAVEDSRLPLMELDIARPGESVRIIPVKDCIEPRVKLTEGKGYFPGFCASVQPVGSGATLVLDGAAVVRHHGGHWPDPTLVGEHLFP